MTQEKSTSNRLLKGTLILTAAGMVVKVIGSLNWIILSRVLGGEGIGGKTDRQGSYGDFKLMLHLLSPVSKKIETAYRAVPADYRKPPCTGA